VLTQLDADQPVLTRLSAAAALDDLPLDREQLAGVTQLVRSAGAVELPYLLAPFARSSEPNLGDQLVEALRASPGLVGLSEVALREALGSYPPDVQDGALPLYDRLAGTTEQQSARLKELEPALSGGNTAQGRVLFFGEKAACSACHAVAGIGGNFGPDLSKIGSIRTPRDLLESVVFPSSSIVRTYEPYLVAMHDGRVHNGLMQHATADAVTLVTTDRTVIRLTRPEIDEIQSSRVSIMPQGLDTQLTLQELGNLIAYLSSLK
jgi:putative heme-binding domain-containing protein